MTNTTRLTFLLEHEQTIHILNTHAGVLSSDYKKGSPKFFAAFANFIELFKKSGFDQSYLDRQETEVTRAFHAFVDCSTTGVTRINPKKHSAKKRSAKK